MVNQEPPVANNTNTITMSMRELDRLKVVEAVVEGRLMPWRTRRARRGRRSGPHATSMMTFSACVSAARLNVS